MPGPDRQPAEPPPSRTAPLADRPPCGPPPCEPASGVTRFTNEAKSPPPGAEGRIPAWPIEPATAAGLPLAGVREVTADETLLLLVPRPGDESLLCGGLLAGAARRGRPPFVMVLGDGSSTAPAADPAADPAALAARHARETAAAIDALGLHRDRLLLAGVVDRYLPDPALFDAAIRAVVAVMWRQDCNLIVAPAPGGTDPGEQAAARIAHAVADRSGVARLLYQGRTGTPAGPGWRLDLTLDLPAKHRAVATHTALPPEPVPEVEHYFRPG